MANGSGSIQCNNCWHFKFSESGRNCRKHDFVFPKTGYEILCRDYRRNFIKRILTDSQSFFAFLILGIPALLLFIFTGGWIDDYKSKRKRKQLEPDVLYFYTYVSRKPMQPFAPFSDLQSLVFAKEVSIKISAEYGLSIHLDSSAIVDIPDLGKDIEIEIDGNKVNVIPAKTKQLLMILLGWARQQPAVNGRMQCFHPPTKDLGRLGVVRDFCNSHSIFAQKPGCAARGKQGPFEGGESFGKINDAGFVVNGENGLRHVSSFQWTLSRIHGQRTDGIGIGEHRF